MMIAATVLFCNVPACGLPGIAIYIWYLPMVSANEEQVP